MIVLPITLKGFNALDSKPKVKKARLESVFHSRFSSDFFFHKGEGLEYARVNRWLTPKMRSHAFFALDSESSQQKGMPFLQLESNGVRSTSLKASSGCGEGYTPERQSARIGWTQSLLCRFNEWEGATSPNSSPLIPLTKKNLLEIDSKCAFCWGDSASWGKSKHRIPSQRRV